MKLFVAAVGRLGRDWAAEGCQAYGDRIDALSRATRIGPVQTREIDPARLRGADAEAAALLAAASSAGAERLIALDETGSHLKSVDFAERLRAWRDDGRRSVAFLIGGADGHGPALRAAADDALSLGAMTWPHALARAMLMEQLYRAATIIAGHPYHREG